MQKITDEKLQSTCPLFFLQPALIHAIPTHGTMVGASQGSSQMTAYLPYSDALQRGIARPDTKMTFGAYFHDWNGARFEGGTGKGARYNMPRSSNMHIQAIYDFWLSNAPEPGITGQALRIIGTPAFLFFSIFDGDVSPADLQSPAEQTYIWGL